MAKSIDARGLDCPQPVILTRKAIESGEKTLKVLVDSDAAKENVGRLGEKFGFSVDIAKDGKDFVLKLNKSVEKNVENKASVEPSVIFISSETVGRGDEELGRVLIKSLIYTLTEKDIKPKKIIFMNSGVKLTIEGSPVLENLQKIESAGTEILICGTCLDFFQLKEKVSVGNISNMYDIVDSFIQADKVIAV